MHNSIKAKTTSLLVLLVSVAAVVLRKQLEKTEAPKKYDRAGVEKMANSANKSFLLNFAQFKVFLM